MKTKAFMYLTVSVAILSFIPQVVVAEVDPKDPNSFIKLSDDKTDNRHAPLA